MKKLAIVSLMIATLTGCAFSLRIGPDCVWDSSKHECRHYR